MAPPSLPPCRSRAASVLYRFPLGGAPPHVLVPGAGEPGRVQSWSVGPDGMIAYTQETPAAPAELFLRRAGGEATALTSFNRPLLATRTIAPVESLRFPSVGGLEVEAFLTRPIDLDPVRRYPLVAMIKGGPHGQQGPTFNAKAQAYAAHGFAVLMVNYRGSTGYGQAFADAIFGDQNGAEAKDVVAGVDAALAKYSWLDRTRSASRAAATAASSPTGSSRRPTVQGGDSGGGHRQPGQLQLHGLLPRLPGGRVRDVPASELPDGKRPAAAGEAMHLMDFLWERSALICRQRSHPDDVHPR